MDNSGQLRRYFYVIPPENIWTKGSPVKTLNIDGGGMSDYHSVYIDGKTLRCRECTCTCNTCISSAYKTKCRNTSYAGNWSSDIEIEQHPSYNKLIQIQKTQSQSVSNNRNNRQW